MHREPIDHQLNCGGTVIGLHPWQTSFAVLLPQMGQDFGMRKKCQPAIVHPWMCQMFQQIRQQFGMRIARRQSRVNALWVQKQPVDDRFRRVGRYVRDPVTLDTYAEQREYVLNHDGVRIRAPPAHPFG